MARGVTDNVASGIQDDCGAGMGRHLVAVRLVSIVFGVLNQPVTNAAFISIESDPILYAILIHRCFAPGCNSSVTNQNRASAIARCVERNGF